MTVVSGVLADLAAESHDLDGLVAGRDDRSTPTPAAGWSVAHQIGHLAWTDEVATVAATDAEAFAGISDPGRAPRNVA